MYYKSIFVNLEIDSSPAPLINFAVGLAREFQATLTGICAADVTLPVVAADGMVFDGETMVLEREEIESRHRELEIEFFKVVSSAAVKAEWQAAVADPTSFLVSSARLADLVVTANPTGNRCRSIDLGSLALSAGRPILVAADGARNLAAQKALVAWKDTREARRAIADSIPMLQRAKEVLVMTVEPNADTYTEDCLLDAVRFLKLHGIIARPELVITKPQGEGVSELARSFNADLVVAGAYGHSRLREWIFGGVTKSLLVDGGLNRFVSN